MTTVIVNIRRRNMAGKVRAQMVEGAVQILARKGLQAASFSEVIGLTGAPRGSLYHHFPEGKNELIGAAVDLAGARALELLRQKAGAGAVEITEYFLHIWRVILSRSKLQAGCAVLAVTVAADSPELLNHAASAFRSWRVLIAELLEQGGLSGRRAARFAATLVAASEGAVVLARAEQSMEPFELVSEELLAQVRSLLAPG
jgi:TetR/AcrR family transcriptional regulator, lmrAB and yxaGH operons repressor